MLRLMLIFSFLVSFSGCRGTESPSSSVDKKEGKVSAQEPIPLTQNEMIPPFKETELKERDIIPIDIRRLCVKDFEKRGLGAGEEGSVSFYKKTNEYYFIVGTKHPPFDATVYVYDGEKNMVLRKFHMKRHGDE